MLSWATTMLGYNARPPLARRGRRGLAGELAEAHRRDAAVRRGLARAPATRRLLEARLGGRVLQHDRCPLLMVGGWADAYRSTVLRVLEGDDGPCKGLIGPWSHHYGFNGLPGPSIGFLQEALRWWDHWLKGRQTDVMEEPALRAWMQESVRADSEPGGDRPGRWVGRARWPPAGRTPDACADARRRSARSGPPHGCVGLDRGHARVRHRRRRLARLRAPRRRPARAARRGRALARLRHPSRWPRRVEILGIPRAHLAVSADQPQALLAVRLCDVAPDGTSTLVTRGVLNLTHRESHESPAPLVPGETVAVRSSSTRSRHSFPPGHRIRLAVSPPTGRGRGRRPPPRS